MTEMLLFHSIYGCRPAVECFRYPGAGHYFLDATLADYDAAAAALAWERIEPFVARLGGG